MSAFRVFGVSYNKCLSKIRTSLPEKIGGVEMAPGEWDAACHRLAGVAYKSGRISAISDKFDAPQFCQDFIDLCDRSKFKDLSIKAYSPVKGKLVAKGSLNVLDTLVNISLFSLPMFILAIL